MSRLRFLGLSVVVTALTISPTARAQQSEKIQQTLRPSSGRSTSHPFAAWRIRAPHWFSRLATVRKAKP
jgi:hypothetical protein